MPPEPAETVFLSLGTNLGDREANLLSAISALPGVGVRVSKVSSFYETEPVDYLDQPWFWNCVVQGETNVPPEDLLRALRELERIMGSKKEIPKGPRLIDLDILLYGQKIVATDTLQIPHLRMHLRKFVLVPLVEIAPDLRHPSWDCTAREILAQIADRSEVRLVRGTP
jgi:2-amino-4-hydroxy-6-hydroxymethyldihydropteridine diphosphokinase